MKQGEAELSYVWTTDKSYSMWDYMSWGDGFLTGEGGFWDQPLDSLTARFGAEAFAFEDFSYDVDEFFDGSFSGFTL